MRRSFDYLAPSYRWLELVFFGGLQRARCAHLAALRSCESILILGEGDGRFLSRLLSSQSPRQVDVVDGSSGMLGRAKDRACKAASDPHGIAARVSFTQVDVREFVPNQTYDAVVTLFFLDCFAEPELGDVVDKLANALRPGGLWLYADFVAGSWEKRAVIGGLYAIFRAVTDIRASTLVDPRGHFRRRGLAPLRRQDYAHRLICSELWQQGLPKPPG